MVLFRLLLAALIPLLLLANGAAFAADGNKNAVKKEGKAGPEYLQMPRMAVAVKMDGTEVSRQLEVELWVYVPNPELMQKLNSRRSVVADAIRANLKKNPVSTYVAPDEGPVAVKEIARDAVEAEIGKDAKEDILIKSMIVR
jgi:flagellar basal body-associated protein FliL